MNVSSKGDEVLVKEYGYEYDAKLDEKRWKMTKGYVTEDKFYGAICLRSGRDAFKVIAREYEPTIILIPALACSSMILPFIMYGYKIIYYRLNEKYTIDIDYLRNIIPYNQKRILFLYMDYFGNDSIDDTGLEALRNDFPKLVFIEDRTHCLLCPPQRKFLTEYTVASLRKWINIPDGGLLWANVPLKNSSLICDTSFAELRLKAQCMRYEYLKTNNESLKINYRKIFTHVSDILDADKSASRMSLYAYETVIQTDWNIIREQRYKNSQQLINELASTDVKFIQNKSGVSDLYVPFIVDKRDKYQAILSSIGIFNTIIWKLNEQQRMVCTIAKKTDEQMLAAPCDQRYSIQDMVMIGKKMVRVLNE